MDSDPQASPPEPTTFEGVAVKSANKIVTWIFGHDSLTTLLMLMVLGGAWAVFYMVHTLVPQWHGTWINAVQTMQATHLEAEDRRIKADADHVVEFARQVRDHREAVERSTDKMIDRMELMQRRPVTASGN